MASRKVGHRKKGTPKTGGRKKGTPNRATVEAKAASSAIVDDARYRRKLLAKARKGTLPPGVECMLWYYAKGKPTEMVGGTLDVNLAGDLTFKRLDDMTDEELAEAKAKILDALALAKRLVPHRDHE